MVASLFALNQANAADIIYPLKEISKPSCKYQDFADLKSSCIQDFPVLKTKNYEKLKDDYDYRRIYTVLWGATYDYAWDIGNGSHLWVDIATSKGTPVYAITEGTVMQAGDKPGWGKQVTIKHYINGKEVYSNYAHLSKITTKVGAKVKAEDKIWEVWNTWNSTGNHLHFQIDVNKGASNHPYYYYENCKGNSWAIVNQGLCRSDLIANTVDPLLFLETAWAIISSEAGETVKEEVKEEAEKKKISQDNLVSQKEIQEREIREFLRDHKIKFKYSQLGNNVPVGDYEILKFSIIEKRTGKPFKGSLPDFMNFVADKTKVKIFPDRLRVTDAGWRDIQILGLKEGKTTLYVRIWDITIYKKTLNVYNPNIKPNIESAYIKTNSWVYLGSEKKGLAILKDDKNTQLISLPYSGDYIMKAQNWLLCPFDVKAKNLSQEMKKTCSLGTLTKQIAFNYNTSYNWILIFGVKPTSTSPMKLEIYSVDQKKVIASKTIKVYAPKWLSKKDPYYEAIMTTLKKSITDWKSGYFLEERTIDEKDAVKWIRNLLIYKRNTASSYSEKQKFEKAISKINKYPWKLNKKQTRGDMLALIAKFVPTDYKKNAIAYRDLTKEQTLQANLVFNKSATWKDKFGEKYFQPREQITRWEAAYMIRQLLK